MEQLTVWKMLFTWIICINFSCLQLYGKTVETLAVEDSSSSSTTCASGYVVERQICNREVAGSTLGRGYFAPRFTEPSIPPGSVNEYQLRLGKQRQVWLIPIANERVGVQVKTVKSLENTRHT